MKHFTLKILAFFLVVFWAGSCIEPFSPPEVNSDEHYLVVDGFLNMGNDTSKIELSRTQNASAETAPIVETGAAIFVEGEQGERLDFIEQGNGLYILLPGALNMAEKYRVNIRTINGREYVSEFVKASKTPAIDSVTYKFDGFLNAMVIKVNTHDPASSTKFYRWKFEDTYEYYAANYSSIMVQGDEIISRRENINQCWKTGKSANIILGSTIKLSKDEVRDLPINIVPVATNKLLVKYSILVKQYALSQEAFEYWTDLAKTTQGTGSLFDPQPSQVTGNIRNTANPKELVFGYFSAGTEEEKRIFIAPRLGSYEICYPDTLPIACSTPDIECAYNTQKLLLAYVGEVEVLAVPPDCADCRLRGGTTKMPFFWQ